MTFGSRLKKTRIEQKLTQQEVADHLEITRQGYAHYEADRRNVDQLILNKLANLLNVTSDYLIGKADIENEAQLSEEEKKDEQLKDLNRVFEHEVKFNGKVLTTEEKAKIIGFMEGMFWDKK